MLSLATLPPELLQLVLSDLRGCDIKNLRLASVYLSKAARLRLQRVFLSAHPRDIEVLNNIAVHPTYKEHVEELIFDDARFASGWTSWAKESSTPSDCYVKNHHQHCKDLGKYESSFLQTPEDMRMAREYRSALSLDQCYRHYIKVAEEQEQAIAADRDIKALENALEHFPNLKRITVTPVAHGVPFRPFYETPMIRSLPYGFIYPIPRPWPLQVNDDASIFRGIIHVPMAWNQYLRNDKGAKWLRDTWRGFLAAIDVLARKPHRVTEFVADVQLLPTGLPCRMFDHRDNNADYDNFLSLLKLPNFSHLDLALDVGQLMAQFNDEFPWACFENGLLRNALSEANLRHFSLSTGACLQYAREHYIPLGTVIPVDQWGQLRHFGLSGFVVKRPDLLDFLRALPITLRSVQLGFLEFIDADGSGWREFLLDVRDNLDWNQRVASERPSIKVCVQIHEGMISYYKYVDIGREVEDFVYRNGKNPFDEFDQDGRGQVSRTSLVGIEREKLNPNNDRPFLHIDHLVDLGLCEQEYKSAHGNTRQLEPLTPEQRAHYKDFDRRKL